MKENPNYGDMVKTSDGTNYVVCGLMKYAEDKQDVYLLANASTQGYPTNKDNFEKADCGMDPISDLHRELYLNSHPGTLSEKYCIKKSFKEAPVKRPKQLRANGREWFL